MGVLWLQFDSTKTYLTEQLESDLDNVSTSLTMAISPHLESGDKVMIDSTLNAYFDGGYYKKIEVIMYQTDEVITKEMPVVLDNVPQWFIDLDFLKIPYIESEVTNGWSQVGKIHISGHPGFAYRQLWGSFVRTCVWLGSLGLLVIIICSYGINVVLRPLVRIQEKAQQIQDHYFGDPLPLPTTRELRDVTVAVNKMSMRLKEQFEEKARLHEKLKEAAFIEPITGFGNRTYFDRRFDAWIKDSSNGAIVIIDIANVESMCKVHGWQKRDEMIVAISHFINNVFDENDRVVKCRISEHEFVLIAEQVDARRVESKLKQLSTYFSSPELKQLFDTNQIFNAGAVKVSHRADKSDILALADKALHDSREIPSGICVIEMPTDCGHIATREEIKVAIEEALEKAAFKFCHQPAFLFNFSVPDHYEVFTSLTLKDHESITSGTFVSVMNEHNLGAIFDKKVISEIFTQLQNKTLEPHAINLSLSALKDHHFIIWLYNLMRNNRSILHKVAFEFNEDSIINDKENMLELCGYFTELGVKFGIDRVGRHFESLAYLQSVHPDYVKVDHSYTEIAVNNKDEAYFVGSLCTTIHNLDIKVIATHVESEEQLAILKEYHFDGYQGFIVKPTDMD